MNIASGGCGMQQEENQLPMSRYLGLFETCMSGYLGLFETCVTEFVQIWVSLLLFWVCLCFLFLERMCCLFLCVFCVFLPHKNSGFMGLFLQFIYGFVWFLGFISCFFGFDGD